MKRKPTFKQTLACILSLLILIGTLPVLSVAAEETTDDPITGTTEDGLVYKVQNGEIIITDYQGIALELSIPDTIIGYPVTGIDDKAFEACSLTNITIPTNITSIGEYAFWYSRSLETIIIPEGISAISDYAFYECNNLKNITLPDSITSIGSYAFYGCNSLKSITLPKHITSIGYYTFHNCFNLESFNVDSYNMNYSSIDGILFDKEITTLIQYPADKEGDTYIVPDSVVGFGWEGFSGCKNLKSVTLPDGFMSIADSAFSHCTNLETVIIPDSVVYIGEGAFYDCTNLTNINIPSNVYAINNSAFCNCTSLKSIVIPNNIETLAFDAFYNCTSLESIILPEFNKSICGYAFYNTAFYNNPDNWENGVLYHDSYLLATKENLSENYTIKDGTAIISIGSFSFSKVSNISIPDSVRYIGSSAFNGCDELKSITLSNNITSIEYSTFEDCINLNNVVIPDSVVCIGSNAFRGCKQLSNFILPETLQEIGKDALYNTSYYNNATNWEDETLYYNSYLLAAKNTINKNCDVKNGTTVIANYTFLENTSLTNITLPDGMLHIGKGAFINCVNLESISMPSTLKTIGPNTFSSCTKLQDLILPENIINIEDSTFLGCSNLSNIVIPEKVKTIGMYAFGSCTNLKAITIPASVSDIQFAAFYNCTNLTDIYYLGSKADWSKISIADLNDCLESAEIHFAKTTPIDIQLTDEATNITIITEADVQLQVETITDTKTIDDIKFVLPNVDVTALYDITLTKDGIEVRPEGTVTVKIPTDNENAKVYRVESDGMLTDMNATYVDGFMVFTTDHFSLYVLAVAKSVSAFDLGDVDKDGDVNIKDATAIQKHIAMLITLDDEAMLLADYDADGVVTIKDATAIQKKIAGLL